MSRIRQFKESPLDQGVDEEIAHSFDTTDWGGYTSGVANVLKDKDGGDKAALLTGSPSESGGVITTSLVHSLLIAESPYRLEVSWVKSGNTFEAYAIINVEE